MIPVNKKQIVSPKKIEKYKEFEETFIRKTKLIKCSNKMYSTRTELRLNTEVKNIDSLLVPCNKIDILPQKTRSLLLKYYNLEFNRLGSYMQHPNNGWVSVFSLNGKDLGFFYFEENETVIDGLTSSVQNHIRDGLTSYDSLPEHLVEVIESYKERIDKVSSLSELGPEVARPMRFYIYPDMQGKGNLNILLSLLTISTALLNKNKDQICYVIEARAGIPKNIDEKKGSQTSIEGHQLIPVYLNKAMDIVRDNSNEVISWINNPYYNMSLSRKIYIKEVLPLLKL